MAYLAWTSWQSFSVTGYTHRSTTETPLAIDEAEYLFKTIIHVLLSCVANHQVCVSKTFFGLPETTWKSFMVIRR